MRIFFIVVIISALACCTQGEGPSSDLSVWSAKFQSLINELGQNADTPNSYKEEVAAMLQKLHRFQTPNTMNKNITLDWFGPSTVSQQTSPMRIVMVVSSFEGMYLNSGIGTFYSALSDFLVSHGHSVTVVYTNVEKSESASKLFSKWKSNNAKRGVVVVKLDPLSVHVTSPSLTRKSYQVYQYLKTHEQEFDVVHFPDWEGPGFFSLLAKHQGLAFASKVFIVGLHGPSRWVKYANQDPTITDIVDVETDWLERRSAELADLIVTPSSDLPQWLAAQGWSLPESSKLHLMPFLPGKEVQMINQRKNTNSLSQKTKVKELVFFGRLESRKGLIAFADALDILASTIVSDLTVTFMGRSTNIDGQSATEYLDRRASMGAWPFKVSYVTHKDRKGSLDYLLEREKGRLAVMPSLTDNAPYTVYECLYSRIPFAASDLPSIAALVNPEDRTNVLFAPTAESIASKLSELINNGAPVARSILSADDATKSWESFYGMVNTKVREVLPSSAVQNELPMVSVCIPYFNRPHLLPMAIESIQTQDFPSSNIEVVLVDDGSTDEDAIKYVESLKDDFEARGWQIIRTENKYLGAARNTAARMARGEYLLFLDDDNIAKHTQISTYVSVAQLTNADIVTAAHDVFKGSELPDESSLGNNIMSRSVPLGPAVSVGIFKNCFGDANFFVKRESFLKTGGFTEERGVGQEDHEYLAKAVLSGLTLEAIPEVLLYYRMHANKEDQMLFNTNPVENQVRSILPYVSILEEDPDTSGLLKVLAHKRVESLVREARGEVTCNMTVLSVSPSSFNSSSKTVLTFTVATADCDIETVYIGSYVCSNVIVQGSTFTCTTPSIPFPNEYSISIQYYETNVIDRTGVDVDVLPSPTVFSSSTAVLVAEFLADPTVYTAEKLFELFGSLVGVSPSVFAVINDIISDLIKRSETQQHNMQLAITTNTNISASAVASQLAQVVSSNPGALTGIGVTVQSFTVVGGCQGAVCQCAPNFAGPGCAEKSLCLNNCTSNGICVDGPFNRVCECYVGFTGRDCSSLSCPNDCSGHGSCLLTGSGAVCKCDLGYSGDSCANGNSCPNNCYGYGTCQQGVCLCVAGRTGSDCFSQANEVQDNTPLASNNDSVTIGLAVAVSVVGVLFIVAAILAVYVHHLRK